MYQENDVQKSRQMSFCRVRYGIMMKRQEFREKAEEIGVVKYR